MPGDEAALESHLLRHWASSMLLRSNFRAYGLVDEGQPRQATYVAAWEGATIMGMATHFGDGTLLLQAPRSLAPIVRAAVATSRRPVTRITGPWPQVEAAVSALGLPPRTLHSGKPRVLASLDVGKLQPPDLVTRNEASARLATQADLNLIVPWRTAWDLASGLNTSEAAVRAALDQQIGVHGVFVVESRRSSQPVAMVAYDVWLPDAVQAGRALLAPALTDARDKAFAAVGVAFAVSAAAAHGVKRAAVLVDGNDYHTLMAYRALGFTPIGDFGTLMLST